MKSMRCVAVRAVFAIGMTVVVGAPLVLADQVILPPRPAPFLAFGWSVAADEDVAIIGAIGSEEVGPLTGSAYIARRGVGGVWSIEADLHPDPAFELGEFGYSVAIDGPTAVVGAPFVGFEGFAYIYRRNASGVWIQEAALTQPTASQPVIRFGAVVAVRGDEAIIASAVDEVEEMWVFVYRRTTAGVWEQRQALQPVGDNSFGTGSSLAIRGNRLVIGNTFSAAATQDPELASAGAAYIFEQDEAGVWHQAALLTASDAAQLDFFGSAVGIDGDTVLVGAAGKQIGSDGMAGAIYTYERRPGGEWVEMDILLDPAPEPIAQLGRQLDFKDGRLAVHTWRDFNGLNSGRARVFRRNGAGWQLLDNFSADTPAQNDFYGSSASLAGDELLYWVNTSNDVGSVEVVSMVPVTPGDVNCDGLVNQDDVAPFVSVILDGEETVCDPTAADANMDGAIDGRDIRAITEMLV